MDSALLNLLFLNLRPLIVELGMHRDTSLLAQIEVASCFRGQPEPLFREISPIIYSFQDL